MLYIFNGFICYHLKGEQSDSLFYSYNNDIGYCLLHQMLKKTKLITIIIHIVNSTYTISYLIGVRPVLISIDHRSRAALDNRKGGGGVVNIKYITKQVLWILFDLKVLEIVFSFKYIEISLLEFSSRTIKKFISR